MDKIVYLFGAGASANALPVVDKIPERLDHLHDRLRDHLKDHPLESNDESLYKEMIEILYWLFIKSKSHASVDTYAKKLFITKKHNDLQKLKMALSLFFIFEQVQNQPDLRYDAFFASILKKSHANIVDFPENIRILTWNYDCQFELAFSEYSGIQDISTNQNLLRVQLKYSPAQSKGFSIYKLNGTTFFIRQNQTIKMFNIQWEPPEIIHEVFSFYKEVSEEYISYGKKRGRKYESLLSFSWEPENLGRSLIESAAEDSKDADIAIIIGYSFPFFNRDIDRQIFKNMKNVKKICFQDPNAEDVIERFKAIRDNLSVSGIELVPHKNIKQFLLPNEL